MMPLQDKTLVFRADASSRIGAGHVMRCLALAQAWQDAGGRAVYAMAMESPELAARLQGEGIEVVPLSVPPGGPEDAAATTQLALARKADWVVLDGYHFNGEYQRAVKRSGLKLLALDDYGHAEHYWADVVLNQDLNAEEALYCRREPYTRLLLGTRYVLLRREFRAAGRPELRIPDRAGRVLVTLGGADPQNLTAAVAEIFRGPRAAEFEVVFVLGPNNPHQAEMEQVANQGQGRLQVQRNVANMQDWMRWCDIAISGGGSTTWELAFFRVPSILLIVAENQRPCAEFLRQQGACRVLDAARFSLQELADEFFTLAAAPAARARLAGQFSGLVDGEGAPRVCRALGQGA